MVAVYSHIWWGTETMSSLCQKLESHKDFEYVKLKKKVFFFFFLNVTSQLL